MAMGEEPEDHQQTPLLLNSDQIPSKSTILCNSFSIKRTGTAWTAVAHIITGVVGSGVLSLAWSMAQLGWIAGPLAMLFFAAVTLLSTFLLCDSYRSPDPEFGPSRNRSYREAVHVILGEKNALICGFLQQVGLCGIGIAYTVTAAISMREIQTSNCYRKQGHGAACENGDTSYMLLFGAAQVLLSQIPDFNSIKFLSVVAAVMSFTYSFIGFALGFAQVIGNGYVKGSITGSSTHSVAVISQALGDIAFSYPCSLILIKIQDTLRSPPSENKTMKKASMIAMIGTTFFYLCCGGFGYAAFGEDTPGNLLAGFGLFSGRYYWLINIANACIVIHLVGSYQVFSQTFFANIEKSIAEKWPNIQFTHINPNSKLPWFPTFQINLPRLCLRTTYVISTTTIAVIFPYFNQVIGVMGGLNFWPLTIYFPVEMYFKQRKIEAWTTKWIMLRAYTIFCLLVTAFALIGSIEGLISAKL
ncbi:probable amino acid permease 7 isoform X1 [Populus alba]|uniref:probable amino acid permease 7 isoform X1 n=1 Tax=Populus alba TaxID=43335 RepID=UPI0015893B05|nr:probable amino acid permease 7 isoform X1 [Populus alba]